MQPYVCVKWIRNIVLYIITSLIVFHYNHRMCNIINVQNTDGDFNAFIFFVACKCEELFNNITYRNLAIQFHLECSYTCLTYYEYHRAKQHLQMARDLLGLDVNMTGGQYNESNDCCAVLWWWMSGRRWITKQWKWKEWI